MSFGWSLSDIALLVRLAYKTTQGARAACGQYDELTRETFNLHIILNRLHEEVANPESSINRRKEAYRHELKSIASGCQDVLTQLDKILTKYNALSEHERNVRKLWKKVRFGNGAVADVIELRSRATYYTSALSLFLNLVAMGSIGEVERKMDRAGGDLEDIKFAVNSIAAGLLAKAGGEGSVLTSYANDDKDAWRELRRGLLKEGFRDSLVRKHMKTIMAYVKELGNRGAFDTIGTYEEPGLPEEHSSRRSSRDEAEASSGASSPEIFGTPELSRLVEEKPNKKSEGKLPSETVISAQPGFDVVVEPFSKNKEKKSKKPKDQAQMADPPPESKALVRKAAPAEVVSVSPPADAPQGDSGPANVPQKAKPPAEKTSTQSMKVDDIASSSSNLKKSAKVGDASNAFSKDSKSDQKPPTRRANQRSKDKDIQREREGQPQYGSRYVESRSETKDDSWGGPRPGWQVLRDHPVPRFIALMTEIYDADSITMLNSSQQSLNLCSVIEIFQDRISAILEIDSDEAEEDLSALVHSATILQCKLMNELNMIHHKPLLILDGRRITILCARFLNEVIAREYEQTNHYDTQSYTNLQGIFQVILHWIREFEVTCGETMRRLSPTFGAACRVEEKIFANKTSFWLRSSGLGKDKALMTFDDPRDKKIHKALLEMRNRLFQWGQRWYRAIFLHDIWKDGDGQCKERNALLQTLWHLASELEMLPLDFTGEEDPRLRSFQPELVDVVRATIEAMEKLEKCLKETHSCTGCFAISKRPKNVD